MSQSRCETFVVTSCVRGYHVYKDRWTPVNDEELSCQRESGNINDPHAVAVLKDGAIVGLVPRKISTLCSMFLRKGGFMKCKVTGSKRYSCDLVQGGLEIPCQFTFVGKDSDIEKLVHLLPSEFITAATNAQSKEEHDNQPPQKRVKIEVVEEATRLKGMMGSGLSQDLGASSDKVWIASKEICLCYADKKTLDDLHVDFGQYLIRKQNPSLTGLKSPLIIQKESYTYPEVERTTGNRFLQIIHLPGSAGHWILASNIGARKVSEVTIYDSLNTTASLYATKLLRRLLKMNNLKVFGVRPQLQNGYNDCSLFALAFGVALVNSEDLTDITYDQTLMRHHLQVCFERQQLLCFPRLPMSNSN